MTEQRDDPKPLDEKDDALVQLLRAAGRRDPVPAERTARVKAHVRAHWQGTVRRQKWQRRGLAGLGLAAAVALAFATWQRSRLEAPIVAVLERSEGAVWFTQRAPGERPSALRAQTGIETGDAGRAALRLKGGASLRIDVLSRARLVSETEIHLERGAVYLDTGGRTDAASLVVRTALGVARDVGTQFEVRVSGPGVRLRVREGLVHLESDGPAHTARPGDELRLAPGGSVVRAAVPLQGAEWEWTQAIAPAFVLEGHSLRGFLDWYSRETQLAVDATRVPEGVRFDAILVHGSLDGLTPSEALAAVLPTCGLTHRQEGATLVLEGAPAAPAKKAQR
jgi:ferric-dicitrate binding protein FerR (iron transport regulator)